MEGEKESGGGDGKKSKWKVRMNHGGRLGRIKEEGWKERGKELGRNQGGKWEGRREGR